MSVTCAPSMGKLGLDSLDREEEEWWAKHLSHRSTSTEAGSNGSCSTGSSTPSPVPAASFDAAPAMFSAAAAAEARRAAAKEGILLPPPQTPGKTGAAGDQRLVDAAAAGDAEAVKRLLLAGASPNSQGPDGTTSLCAAAMWGHPQVVTLLLSAGAAPNLANRSGSRPTALHLAALQEHGKVCMLLLAAGADPSIVDSAGASAADVASCSEALWPHFAAKGCERKSKLALVERGVIRKASSTLEQELGGAENAAARQAGLRGLIPEFSRPGSSYVVTSHFPPRPGSSMGRSGSLGSLVKSRGGSQGGSRPSSGGKILSQSIDILGDGLCELPSRPGSRASQKGASGFRKSGSLASLGL